MTENYSYGRIVVGYLVTEVIFVVAS